MLDGLLGGIVGGANLVEVRLPPVTALSTT